jgi:hypothetical protein
MGRCRGVIAFDHTKGHIRVGRTPLDEGSARRRDLYLTTHNNHNRQTSTPPGGFVFFLCTSSVLLLCPECPGCALCPFCPYCATHTTQTSMPPAGFKPPIPAGDRPQTLALDRSATGIGREINLYRNYNHIFASIMTYFSHIAYLYTY